MDSTPASGGPDSHRPQRHPVPSQSDLRIKARLGRPPSSSFRRKTGFYVIERRSSYSLRDASRVTRLPESQIRRAILLNELSGIEVSDDRQYLISGEDLRSYLLSIAPKAVIRSPQDESDPGSIAALVILILIPLLALASVVIGALSTSDRQESEFRPTPPPLERTVPQYGTHLLEPPASGGKNTNEPAQDGARRGSHPSQVPETPHPPQENPHVFRGTH
jgi:hypothetical protein